MMNYFPENDERLDTLERKRRQTPDSTSEDDSTVVYAMLLEDTHSKKSYNDMGVISVTENNDIVLFLVDYIHNIFNHNVLPISVAIVV